MKIVKGAFTFFLILLFPFIAVAGQIYGNLKCPKKAIAAGKRITVQCGGKNFHGSIDRSGSYGVFVPQKGKCSVIFPYSGKKLEHRIYSYADPVRYDFEVVEKRGRAPFLKRR